MGNGCSLNLWVENVKSPCCLGSDDGRVVVVNSINKQKVHPHQNCIKI